ncbi:TfoX/Sxy family protein [Mycolicibacter longobardus]|uniref:RNA methyltransferase n=1 Tax=Mycolicibacter longobardus TaxID=1108812 RepID=A0A1X1YKL1_9MYCO|nr:TfoX/Sxy family protein [Mycolicibacter longobardus]MCV7383951.1 TfoX/Sxy family protein [Mycolicibacter longobardus]ORW11553.1 RNA methyltransferase [Mycolicibacter longobardus]
MAYDKQLAARVREMFADGPPVLEKAMFGGLAFLVAGKIAVAAMADGLLVRVGVARAEQVLKTTAAQPMEMGGRTMRGWVHVDGRHLRSRRQLGEWIDIGIDAAASA